MSNNIINPSNSKAFSGIIYNFCDRMVASTNCENSMTEVMPLKDVTDTFARVSKRVDDKFNSSDRGKELLYKVSYYKIPYSKDSINWLELIDEVAYYEKLLEESYNLGIDWDISEYDVVGLKQEIEYHISQERANQEDLYHSFYNKFSLGV